MEFKLKLATDPCFVDKVPGFFPYEDAVRFIKGEKEGRTIQPGMSALDVDHGKVRVICASESHAVVEYSMESKGHPKTPLFLKKGKILWLSDGYYRETSLSLRQKHPNVPVCPESRPASPGSLGIHEEYELLLFLMEKFLQEPLIHEGEFHKERKTGERLRNDIAYGMRSAEKGIPTPAECGLSYLSKTVHAFLNTFREGKDSTNELHPHSE